MLESRNFPAGTEVQSDATQLLLESLSDAQVQREATLQGRIKAFTYFSVDNNHNNPNKENKNKYKTIFKKQSIVILSF